MNNNDSHNALFKAKSKLERVLVEHDRFEDAAMRIMSAILFPTDTKIIWVIGPTGAGKSRLAQTISTRIQNAISAGQITDQHDIPSISMEVPGVSNNHRFAWKEFYADYLAALKAPLTPTAKALAELPGADPRRGLEHVVLNALQFRRPLATLLDEANHFTCVASGKALIEQTTRLKSFVNRSGVLHVCFGTYDLAQMMNLSGQLARRCEVIHFGRYRREDYSEFKAFEKVVRNFQATLQVAHHFDLRAHYLYLHERSLGCVGTLKTWLMRALSHANVKERKALTFPDLEATALPVDRLRTMLNEAVSGEAQFAEPTQKDLDLFREDLGHTAKPDRDPERDLLGEPLAQESERPTKTNVKPFEPNLVRRPTGGGLAQEAARRAS